MSELTELLTAVQCGDEIALNRLLSLLYQDLRALAHARLARSQKFTLLDTTALVHESYLRLVQSGRLQVENRGQFFAYAATTMRTIIVDHVRERQSQRRAGGSLKVTLTEVEDPEWAGEAEIIRIHDALAELGQVDSRLVKVVEMRYFGGLTLEEVAEALAVTERTVRRDWTKARVLLRAALE